ncbi:hypothetical protein CYMTET_35899 [Cymbomonas tetramitiformis]|uniref:Uncharacterized protein n=1 Tax=Cymbomonas tetramitiformis TaxID=36881 RepID=A0AAE0F8C9_9CHLO|nr:hypothetical protein CYMTET_35899 [Cymbomonas tetramitiformis]
MEFEDGISTWEEMNVALQGLQRQSKKNVYVIQCCAEWGSPLVDGSLSSLVSATWLPGTELPAHLTQEVSELVKGGYSVSRMDRQLGPILNRTPTPPLPPTPPPLTFEEHLRDSVEAAISASSGQQEEKVMSITEALLESHAEIRSFEMLLRLGAKCLVDITDGRQHKLTMVSAKKLLARAKSHVDCSHPSRFKVPLISAAERDAYTLLNKRLDDSERQARACSARPQLPNTMGLMGRTPASGQSRSLGTGPRRHSKDSRLREGSMSSTVRTLHNGLKDPPLTAR